MLSFANIGSTGIFAGVIIGLLSTELFIRIAGIEKLNISLGENVPPAVGKFFRADSDHYHPVDIRGDRRRTG
jgi:PTS system cellobiose-specific IIC component